MIEEDFVGWLQESMSAPRPIEVLSTLEAYQQHPQISQSAFECLDVLIRRHQETKEESYGLVFMLSATAFLKLKQGVPLLLDLANEGFDECRISQWISLESLFAIHALRYIEGLSGRFEPETLFDEHSVLKEQIYHLLQNKRTQEAEIVQTTFAHAQMRSVQEIHEYYEELKSQGADDQPVTTHSVLYDIPQQPSVEQPSVEQPSVEQPSVEQPSVEQPSVEQPSVEQPSVEQPSVEQPSVEQLSVEQPSVEQLSVEQLSVEQLSVEQPSVEQLSVEQLSVEQPSVEQPASAQQPNKSQQFNSVKERSSPHIAPSSQSIWLMETNVEEVSFDQLNDDIVDKSPTSSTSSTPSQPSASQTPSQPYSSPTSAETETPQITSPAHSPRGAPMARPFTSHNTSYSTPQAARQEAPHSLPQAQASFIHRLQMNSAELDYVRKEELAESTAQAAAVALALAERAQNEAEEARRRVEDRKTQTQAQAQQQKQSEQPYRQIQEHPHNYPHHSIATPSPSTPYPDVDSLNTPQAEAQHFSNAFNFPSTSSPSFPTPSNHLLHSGYAQETNHSSKSHWDQISGALSLDQLRAITPPPALVTRVTIIQAIFGLFTLLFGVLVGWKLSLIGGWIIVSTGMMYRGRRLGWQSSILGNASFGLYLFSSLLSPEFPIWLQSPFLYLLALSAFVFAGILLNSTFREYFKKNKLGRSW